MAADDRSWTKCTTPDKVISVNQYIHAAISSGVFGAIMIVFTVAAFGIRAEPVRST